MRHTVLIETQYLAPINAYGLFINARGVCFEMQENYQKRSYRNRCKLIGPNGVLMLSVPLRKGKNQQTSIRDVMVSYDMPWVSNHLQTIRACYGRSSYFDFIYEGIEKILLDKPKFLQDLNINLFFNIVNFLGFDLTFTSSVIFDKKTRSEPLDLRNCMSPVNSSTLSETRFPDYQQVFIEKNGFVPDLSIIDLLFCLGKEAVPYLKKLHPVN